MNNGAKVVAKALSYEGTTENPLGSNRGEHIDRWQTEAEIIYGVAPGTYRGAAWCAIGLGAWFREAGVEIPKNLAHPWTGFIAHEADQLGGLAPRSVAPPGSLILRAGVHVGLVVRDRGDGMLDTVEANAGHAVRRLVRARADWRIVVPPAIAEDPPETPLVVMRESYGFDDLWLRPDIYGGWDSPMARDAVMERFHANHPERWVAPVRVDAAAPFAFRTGAKGTYGEVWRFGGWSSKAIRDEQMRRYGNRVEHRNLRTWAKRVPVPAAALGVSVDVTTT